MYICVSKKQILTAGLVFGLLGVFFFSVQRIPIFLPVGSFSSESYGIVVLDAGHGGEDGGAVSPDGVKESGINLEITQRLADLLFLGGENVVMVRNADCSLSDSGTTVRARKVSDLENRVKLVNGQEKPILLSIHQNSLPSSPVTHGAQAFWNQNPGAAELADRIQENFNVCINDRDKIAKKVAPEIYLMKNVDAPAVLLECGFLSNTDETLKLQQASHQILISTAIVAGYFSTEGDLS